MPIVSPTTGEVRQAQVFVAVLGASNYTFAEATWSQSLPDWLQSHVRAFEFFGGTPALLIPDNLKSGVSKACRYDPELNPSYQQLAEHYQVAVMPARPYKPKDKAKARWVCRSSSAGSWPVYAIRPSSRLPNSTSASGLAERTQRAPVQATAR